ncbi:methyltransferase domain-containing protein [Gordonia amarae]|uniref:Methyltransferase domain-containing protein n=2 Tax=Gordonia amarae TaxID=36821 RepID=A0A857KZL1_9ACTN|nr:class I SAM-dependent methyltransferase [Gordonia amarae]MCS3879902.1 SAM-dependent methyltransferase [Gordonia amarae]QHN18310.1 methyltransferase domain-containing protein [Gordonia amarae]QHN22793.1 methyltransferase domain-containing protein [Gordonia amarae]QHN31697.1 methyltransferase domain-containing protein [Gordonia amarae]QHN40441.1 methyltransferase domain-containing protein [Gordonia amarae]
MTLHNESAAQAAIEPETQLALTGERTVPGIAEENYWFRRHEIAYTSILADCRDKTVLEAGSGEGYGAALLATVAESVTCVDYDTSAVEHTRRRYPELIVHQGNLIELPIADASVDVVVNFQVIEHLWDQPQFIAECLRVLRPGGRLLISTPNRITFSPGRDTPLNPFHTRELNAAELTELLVDGGFEVDTMFGVYHGAAIRELDAKWGGSIIDAQIERSLAGVPWPDELAADVAAIATDDFDVLDTTRGTGDIDASLDLFAVAVRP